MTAVRDAGADPARQRTSRRTKYEETAALVAARSIGSVLDVGCRDGVLHRELRREGGAAGRARYAGVDLQQNAEGTVEYVCDVTRGIPVEAGAFELVVALDLLEHLDDLQAGLDELDRASSRYVAVTLPNLAHAYFRLRFLVTGRLSGKYDLAYDYGVDRHRWFTVLSQTDEYMRTFATSRGYGLDIVHLPNGGRRIGKLERLLRALRFGPDWHVWVALYVMDKGGADDRR